MDGVLIFYCIVSYSEMCFRTHYGHLLSHTSSGLEVNREEHTLLVYNSCYLEIDSSWC